MCEFLTLCHICQLKYPYPGKGSVINHSNVENVLEFIA